jgi:hypothetical protein
MEGEVDPIPAGQPLNLPRGDSVWEFVAFSFKCAHLGCPVRGDLLTRDQMTIRISNGGTNMPGYAGTLSPGELPRLFDFLDSRRASLLSPPRVRTKSLLPGPDGASSFQTPSPFVIRAERRPGNIARLGRETDPFGNT